MHDCTCDYCRKHRGPRKLRAIYDILEDHSDKLDDLSKQLSMIFNLMRKSLKMEFEMATDLTALTDAVAEDTSVDESAITLLQNLSTILEDAKTDPVAIASIAASLKDNAAALAAAIAANTPAA